MRRLFALLALLLAVPVSAQTVAVQVSIPVQTTFTINGVTVVTTGTATGTIYVPDTSGNPPAHPTAPTLNPNVYCYGGQSNMVNLVLGGFFRARGISMYGYAEGAKPIAYWDGGADGWTRMLSGFTAPGNVQVGLQNHVECSAFVWFQGETDDVNLSSGQPGAIAPVTYTQKFIDLITRVRAAVGNPNLRILSAQINSQYTLINPAIAAGCAQVPNCQLVPTWDLEFADGIHLDNQGASDFVTRVLALP